MIIIRHQTVVMTLAFASLAGGDVTAQDRPKVDDTRSILQRYVEMEGAISKERKDWAEGRGLLQARVEVLKSAIEALRREIGNAEESISEADKARDELIRENERLKEASASLDGQIGALETRTKSLLRRLPGPILEVVKPISQRIPPNPNDTKLTLWERFFNVVGVLNEIDGFNQKIHMTTEVRTLSDDVSVEVTAIYVGIGQGYYANAQGTIAGIGSASEEGWTWTEANEAGPAVLRVIAILKGEEIAQFVRLPVKIR